MRALISVYDKTGIIDLAKILQDFGYEIISTGKTKKILEGTGLTGIKEVADITGIGELLQGRVKTLHPYIHAGILAKRIPSHLEELKKYNIQPIDIVVVNLYPFIDAVISNNNVSRIIENIDIGGVTLIRAAAKNYDYVACVTSPSQYQSLIEDLKNNQGKVSSQLRLRLAEEAFEYIAFYDTAISEYFRKKKFPQYLTKGFYLQKELLYGENPHQKGYLYKDIFEEELPFKQLQGRDLSFNNLLDMNTIVEILDDLSDYNNKDISIIIKHNISCGVAVADSQEEAFLKAYESDKLSAFGGVFGFNKPLTKETAQVLKDIFIDLILAPSFSEEAISILKEKKNLRLVEYKLDKITDKKLDFRLINKGLLLQEKDKLTLRREDLKFVTRQKPTESQIEDMIFGFLVVKNLKSNAVCLVKDLATVGVGQGQPSRIDALYVALNKAGNKACQAILASDGFFPFTDSIEEAYKHKVGGIIQPGGSIKDEEIINKADELKIPMVFTGIRHFKH